MSVEQVMIAQARPHVLAARARSLIGQEAAKGCNSSLHADPVALEPPFRLLRTAQDVVIEGEEAPATPEPVPDERDLLRLRIWIAPEQKFEWHRSELLLKQLSLTRHRVGYEIVGNQEGISFGLLCHRADLPLIASAFSGVFAHCRLGSSGDGPCSPFEGASMPHVLLLDYYPPPPYSHLLTRPAELKVTPFEALLAAITEVPSASVAGYQCLFQAVSPNHNWHRNVQALLDFEYVIRSLANIQGQQRYMQQGPSGDLRNMASEVETKAHNDKPFFCAALRVFVLGGSEDGLARLLSLSSFAALLQHGGRPLSFLSHEDYARSLPYRHIRNMLLNGLVYRPGFLVNSEELTSLAHVFPVQATEDRSVPFEALDLLSIDADRYSEGICVGVSRCFGEEKRVCISHQDRPLSTHIIASPGMGKSALMIRMLLQDAEEGTGAAFIDAHGDAIRDLLRLLPPRAYPKVVYFKPGDPEWVPLWNPMHLAPGADMYRLADDIVSVFKRLVRDWGDRMEHVLRSGSAGRAAVQVHGRDRIPRLRRGIRPRCRRCEEPCQEGHTALPAPVFHHISHLLGVPIARLCPGRAPGVSSLRRASRGVLTYRRLPAAGQ